MDESMVIEAKNRMKRITKLVKIIVVVAFIVQGILVIGLMFSDIEPYLRAFIIFLTGYVVLLIIMLTSLERQKAIFDVAISLLRYIEKNYPDVELPSYDDEDIPTWETVLEEEHDEKETSEHPKNS
jgi:hypothetical protein